MVPHEAKDIQPVEGGRDEIDQQLEKMSQREEEEGLEDRGLVASAESSDSRAVHSIEYGTSGSTSPLTDRPIDEGEEKRREIDERTEDADAA